MYYPFQERALARWAGLQAPKRLILGWPTGSGKTRIGLECSREGRVLVIGPALSLGVWRHQASLWLKEGAGIYDKSLSRKQLSKKEKARLEAALQGRIVLTTPHFAFSDPVVREAMLGCSVILDEGHMYANPLTERSFQLREWLARAPDTQVLLLTATLFPKEIRDVWNPVQSLFPAVFPPPVRDTGGVPFSFLHKFALRSELGFFHGTRAERLPLLRQLLDSVADIVSEEEVLAVVPKLQIAAVAGDGDTYREWVGTHEQARSVALITFTRARAEEYAAYLRETKRRVACLHGGTPALQRFEELEELREAYRAGESVGIAATADSVLESVSLAWFERALLTDWRRTPRQVLQLLGRFRRPDPDKRVPTVLDLLVEEAQEAAIQTALTRLDAFEQLLGASANAQAFSAALREGSELRANMVTSVDAIRAMFESSDSASDEELISTWFSDE